jgi:hypothetical protein
VESQKFIKKGEFTPIDDQAIKRARLKRTKNSIRYISESSDDEVSNEATGETTAAFSINQMSYQTNQINQIKSNQM